MYEVENAPMIASGPSASAHPVPAEVPETPDVFAILPSTPRGSPTTRPHEVEPDDHGFKRAKTETAKKQRIERISAEHEAMVRMVQFADESLHTMDEYGHDLSMSDHDAVELWLQEENDGSSC